MSRLTTIPFKSGTVVLHRLLHVHGGDHRATSLRASKCNRSRLRLDVKREYTNAKTDYRNSNGNLRVTPA